MWRGGGDGCGGVGYVSGCLCVSVCGCMYMGARVWGVVSEGVCVCLSATTCVYGLHWDHDMIQFDLQCPVNFM